MPLVGIAALHPPYITEWFPPSRDQRRKEVPSRGEIEGEDQRQKKGETAGPVVGLAGVKLLHVRRLRNATRCRGLLLALISMNNGGIVVP